MELSPTDPPDAGAQDLAHIRRVLDRHTRFLSLSGLSGVASGLVALAGLSLTYWYLQTLSAVPSGFFGRVELSRQTAREHLLPLASIALLTFGGALAAASYFTRRLALRHGHTTVWNASAQRLAFSLFTPIAAGVAVCGALLFHAASALVPPASLVFYGLGLVSASSHTLREVRALGLVQLCIGVMGLYRPEFGLALWGVGFGVLHILYGVWLYRRYELPERTSH